MEIRTQQVMDELFRSRQHFTTTVQSVAKSQKNYAALLPQFKFVHFQTSPHFN